MAKPVSNGSTPQNCSTSAPEKDILIVGGCVAGLSAALMLSRAGHRVHVMDSDILEDTDTALQAFEQWDRRGSPQAHHAHAFLGRLHRTHLMNMGNVYVKLAQHDAALALYERAKELLLEMLEPTHPNVQLVEKHIGLLNS